MVYRRAKQLRQEARKALTGRYWQALLASLVAGILGGATSVPSLTFRFNDDYQPDMDVSAAQAGMEEALAVLEGSPLAQGIMAFFLALLALAAAVSIVQFIIGGAMELGYNLYNIRLFERRETPEFSTLFSRFSIFGRALGLRILMALKVFAWMLLLIVPGIVASYRYAMAPYILAEHPELTAGEAIERSKDMMQGNKSRLFWLGLSFFGWFLLVPLTFGLGGFFLAPYIKAATTAFYMELSGRLPAGGQAAA